MKRLLFLALAAAGAVVSGCQDSETGRPAFNGKHPVPADKQAYVGHWRGDGQALTIYADGAIRYKRTQYLGLVRYQVASDDLRFTATGFEMGSGEIGAIFKVLKPPHRFGNDWTLVLARGAFSKDDHGEPGK